MHQIPKGKIYWIIFINMKWKSVILVESCVSVTLSTLSKLMECLVCFETNVLMTKRWGVLLKRLIHTLFRLGCCCFCWVSSASRLLTWAVNSITAKEARKAIMITTMVIIMVTTMGITIKADTTAITTPSWSSSWALPCPGAGARSHPRTGAGVGGGVDTWQHGPVEVKHDNTGPLRW